MNYCQIAGWRKGRTLGFSPMGYIRGIRIGEGAYGSVYVGVDPETKKKVAIKEIKRSNTTYNEGLNFSVLREIKILKELRHPHLLELLDVSVTPDGLELVLDLCETDLKKVIEDRKHVTAIRLEDAKSYLRMTLRGIEFLHRHWVLHRDLKPENLLISSSGMVKIADFGLARYYGTPDREVLTNNVITRQYRPPELLMGSRYYGAAVDMWSVGCIFAEMRLRELLFRGDYDTDISTLQKIFHILGTPTEANWPGFTSLPEYAHLGIEPRDAPDPRKLFTSFKPDALDLLLQLLSMDPNQRLTALEALAHPFFTTDPSPTPPAQLPLPPSKA